MSDNSNSGRPELIDGIEKDARQEADSILEKARTYVREREEGSVAKLAAITREAEEKLKGQVEEIRRTSASNLAVEKRRIALRIRDRFITDITREVREKLSALQEKPGYTSILEGWILEAVIGLGSPEATVNASLGEKPLVTPELLAGVAAKAREMTGRDYTLTPSAEPPLAGQGIVVTAADGRTAFNNQVGTRLLRYQSEIRKLIYDALFEDEL